MFFILGDSESEVYSTCKIILRIKELVQLKKLLGISVLALLLIGAATVFVMNQREVSINDVPDDVPIIKGKVLSTKTLATISVLGNSILFLPE